jgi:hypothetical protein
MNQERTCTTHLARARVQAAVPSCDRAEYPHSGVTSPRSISSISTDRSDSAEANSFAACCAVLPFEPHTAMPPSNAATAAPIIAGSNRMTPKSIPASTRQPPATAIRETKINLRQLSISAPISSMRSSRRTTSSCGSPLWSSSKFNAPEGSAHASTCRDHMDKAQTIAALLNRYDFEATETALAGWGAWIRTREWRNQNPLPYHLATPQCSPGLPTGRPHLRRHRRAGP